MSDITQFSQATISKALTQLSQMAATSDLARQGVEVLVKHLAGNQLSLSKSSALVDKVAILNTPKLSGKLTEGQFHQVKLTLDTAPTLDFFSSTSNKTTQVIQLSEQQLQAILKISPKQLLASRALGKFDTITPLPTIKATVLPALTKEQLTSQVTQAIAKTPVVANPIENKDVSLPNQLKTLRILLNEQRPPLEVSLPVKQLNQFSAGDKLTLAISPKGNNWQLTIVQQKAGQTNQAANTQQDKVRFSSQVPAHSQAQTASPTKVTGNPLVTTAQTNPAASSAPTNITPTTNQIKNVASLLSPVLAIPLIKASLSELKTTSPASLELAIKPILQQLNKLAQGLEAGQIQKLQALPIDKIVLQITQDGDPRLLIQNKQPVASLTVTKEIAQALAPLKLPNQQSVSKLVASSTELNNSLQVQSQSTRVQQNPNNPKITTPPASTANINQQSLPKVPPVDGNKSPETSVNLKQAAANLLTLLQDKPVAQSIISSSLVANKPEQINLVQGLLRIVQAKAEAPAVTLQAVETALLDKEFFKGTTEQPIKQVIEQVIQQIKQALPQGKEQDPSQIRQLLTTPTLNLSALQMINPTANQGFMSGLITLLQMSLSARLSRSLSHRAEHIGDTLNNVLASTGKSKASASPKSMGEMAQMEQKHQLIKEIGRLLSAHQTSKLSNAEQMIQGQESFYYNLPTALGGVIKDVELLIKREDDNQNSPDADQQNNKVWQLTMKLSVGEMGELLTKAKLHADTLDINFYASNESVKIQVMNYLPLLRKKFDSLGIELTKSHCQLGKIPDSLQQRPYHMFQAKA